MEKIIKNIKLNYIIEGEGEETVFVLHGWGANIPAVMPIVNSLKDRFKVYAIDLPGFGESDEPEEAIDSFEYAEIVREFILDEGLEKVHLVGHSFGGKLSIILSSKYPDMVDKIVLVDSAGLIPKRGIDYYFRVYSYKFLRFIGNTLFFWVKKEKKLDIAKKLGFGSDDYQDSSGVMRQILVKVVNENLEYLLEDIKAPTLLIWGSEDDATPLYMAKTMEEKISDSGLVVFEGAGHFAYLDNYYKFTRVINAFF